MTRPRLLPGYTLHPSPSQSSRNDCEPTVLVVHYTASLSDDGALRWLRSPESGVSAHFVVARDGRVTQLVPLDRAAWHAGASEWRYREQRRRGVNDYSIGVELCNVGPVVLGEHGAPMVSFGGRELPYRGPQPVEALGRLWEPYPEAQIEALDRLVEDLRGAGYELEMVGHNEVSPGRKMDPGPVFPWARYRKA